MGSVYERNKSSPPSVMISVIELDMDVKSFSHFQHYLKFPGKLAPFANIIDSYDTLNVLNEANSTWKSLYTKIIAETTDMVKGS